MKSLPFLCLLLAWSTIFVGSLPAQASEKAVVYETDVRPILKAHCFHCHGEEKELAGGLDLRLGRLIIRGGDSGPSVVVGKSSESLLIDYVESEAMPPDDEPKLTAEQISILARWIDTGSTIAEAEPEADPVPGRLLITNAERSHWAYQPIQKPEIPARTVNSSDHPIDAFIGAKLAEHQLTFSPEADRIQLIRRVTHNLTGLPPTPAEVQEFVSDTSPEAYENLIDRLLASPQYGERWGRHWLDAAGYADSEGYNDKDTLREDAWKYRDYVIRSFNADKPWDRFVLEQLAGDELVSATTANANALANQSEEMREALIATGFLRMAPDGSGSQPMEPEAAKNQVITETIKILTSSLLASTVACAECHHHRYDPIPQDDFYRLRAVLAPVYNLENWRMPASRRISLLSQEDQKKADEIEAEARKIDQKRNETKHEIMLMMLERVVAEIPVEKQKYAREAFETAKAERSPEQTQFVVEEYPMLGLLNVNTIHLFLQRFPDGKELQKRYEDLQNEAAALRKTKPTPELVRVALEDPNKIPKTFLFHRGDYTSPVGDPIEPGGLSLFAQLELTPPNTTPQDATSGTGKPKLSTSGRRLAWAQSLVSGQHPLVARVLVNRFWHHHFGQGLVDTPGDFGLQGSTPSHPELLDWLATNFMEEGWSLKKFHRLILTSQTYRQSSQRQAAGEAIDVENKLLWRMPVQRREAEAIRDSILFVSGELNPEPFGPPIPVATNSGGILTVGGGKYSADKRENKRTIYVQVRRTTPVAMLQAFDAPQMEPNCERRLTSTVATQALALLNSDFVMEQSTAFASRILQELEDPKALSTQVDKAWQWTFSRKPTAVELSSAVAFLQAQTEEFQKNKTKNPEQSALASLGQVLFGSNEFLYVD